MLVGRRRTKEGLPQGKIVPGKVVGESMIITIHAPENVADSG